VDWITVKSTWALTATITEWDALGEMLDTCHDDVSVGTLTSPMRTPTPGLAVTQTTPILTTTSPSGLQYDTFGPNRNCGDFSTWQKSQDFFLAAGGPSSDPHGLDGNHDGIACQSLSGAP
jgi:hypothetical protein